MYFCCFLLFSYRDTLLQRVIINWFDCFQTICLLSITEIFKCTLVYQTLLTPSPSFLLILSSSHIVCLCLLGYFKASLRHSISHINISIYNEKACKDQIKKREEANYVIQMWILSVYLFSENKWIFSFSELHSFIFFIGTCGLLYWHYFCFAPPPILLRYNWHIVFYFLMMNSLRERNFSPIFEFPIALYIEVGI